MCPEIGASGYRCVTLVITCILLYACAYNIEDLYHTGRIDPPGMVKVVYIVCAYTYTGYVIVIPWSPGIDHGKPPDPRGRNLRERCGFP